MSGAGLGTGAGTGRPAGSQPILVDTAAGRLEGFRQDGLCAFLGIPYAQAPVGRLRFRPPEPAAPWSGVRPAYAYGPRAPQEPDAQPSSVPMDEDCLNLNVWTPAPDGAGRPVVVFFHGGGRLSGSNSDPNLDGAHLLGGLWNCVYVSVNYRLGLLGYLYLGEALGPDYALSGSSGLMDQILALEWVRDNIRAFGGDPARVTLLGQSGGAKSVADLMISPRTRGLFQGAILMSGAGQCNRDAHTSACVTQQFLAETGLTPQQLLTLPAEDIIQAQARYGANYKHFCGPMLDGYNLTLPAAEALSTGLLDGVRVLIGHTHREMQPASPALPVPKAERLHWLQTHFGLNSPHVIAVYEELLTRLPEYEAWGVLMTDYLYGHAALATAELLAARGIPTWVYRWDHPGPTLAQHGSDLPYLYRYPTGEPEADYDALCRLLRDAWLSFLQKGDPRTPALPDWPPYTRVDNGRRAYLSLAPSCEPFDLRRHDQAMPLQEFRL